jgi:hypothetical protein
MLRRPEVALFTLVLGVYAYFYQAGGWNQNSRFDLTRALVDRGTVAIDDYRQNTGDLALRDGHYYCDKAPGLSLMAVPAYALARGLGPDGAAYVSTLFAVGLPTALAVVALFLLVGALVPEISERVRAAIAATYALGTLAFPYATMLYGHQIVADLLILALAIVLLRERPAALAVAGALLGWAIAVEYPAALGGLPIFVWAAVRHRRRALWIVLGGVAPIAVLMAYHAIAFGGPFTLPYAFDTQKHRHMGFFMGLGVPNLRVLGEITFGTYRGLFFSAPWLLLGAVGIGVAHARQRTRALGFVCAWIVVYHLWLNSSLVDWEGGWAIGPRYLVPALPFVALGVVVLPRRPLVYAAGAVLAVVSIGLTLVGVAVKPEVYVKIQRPYQEFLFPLFARGQLAVNTQSIDMKGAPGAPPAAWNLGQKLGLHGLPSLLPLLVFVGVCAVWLLSNTSRRRRADPPATAASG